MNTAPGMKAIPLPQLADFGDTNRQPDRDAPLRLQDIVQILRKRLWVAGLTTFAAIAIAVINLSDATPQYRASAQMLLGGQGQIDRRASDLLEARVLSDTVIQGELAILRSSALLIRIVQRLELEKDSEFNRALRPPEEPSFPFIQRSVDGAKDFVKGLLFPPAAPSDGDVEASESSSALADASSARDAAIGEYGGTIDALRGSMRVRQLGSSLVVEVTVVSADPIKAAGIANTVVEEYIAFVGDKRFDAAQRFTTWLEIRVAELAATVEESERAVLSYQARIDNEADSFARLEQQMVEMTSKLVDARASLAETEARAGKARNLLKTEGAAAAAGLLSSTVLSEYTSRLAQLRREETAAARRFGVNSPQADAIRREAADIRSNLNSEVALEIAELENSAEVMRINADALRATLSQLEDTVLNRSKEQIRLNQLERVADANRRLYEDFLSRFKESSEIQNLRAAEGEVISYAAPPTAPSAPNKKVTLVLATAAGGMLGLGLIFLLELLPKRFATSDDIARRTGMKVFGHLPRLPRRNGARSIQRLLESDARIARGVRSLARNLKLGLGRPVHSMIIVSHASGGDKTTTAMMLGWALAQEGKTCLLVDADIRSAALSGRFDLRSWPNLVDVLYDEAEANDAVQEAEELGVWVLPTRRSSVDPATLFATDRAGVLFRDLSQMFDAVIIDAPPLDGMADSVLLPDAVDAALYVVRSNRTPVATVGDRMHLFNGMQKLIGGAVLTRLPRGLAR